MTFESDPWIPFVLKGWADSYTATSLASVRAALGVITSTRSSRLSILVLRRTSLQYRTVKKGHTDQRAEGRVTSSGFLLPALLAKFTIFSPGAKHRSLTAKRILLQWWVFPQWWVLVPCLPLETDFQPMLSWGSRCRLLGDFALSQARSLSAPVTFK